MTITELLDRVSTYHPTADLGSVQRAYDFSAEVHRGQKRRSGEAYVTHPLEVAGIIVDMRLDVPSIVTGLLHDTVEDTLATLEQLSELFGPEVAHLVDGVTKIGQINFTSREEKQAENFRKMLLAMARDIRVILVKLADRTHNMRTLAAMPHERQLDVAQETLEIYAPLAHRLGVNWIKSELEDNALRYLHPEVYHQLKRNVAKKKAERDRFTREVTSLLSRELAKSGLDVEVSGRPKHFYSIYHKMQTQNLLFDQIYDLVGFRVLVDSVGECYEALGVVHALWKPVPGRFKDYIALPKPNGYQSLHTTVIGPYGERIEIQIRTREMHRVAEYGIAAHWRYKAAGDGAPDDLQRFAWLRQMLELQQHVDDPQEFLRSVKEDLFADEVFVFTPKGDLLSFPVGATVIDFAYRIHSEVGHHCTGARVNGRIVPLRYVLQSGDTVEIVTTAQQTPSKDWLKWAKSSRAKNRIRAYVKAQQSARSAEVGQELLERDLGRHQLDLAKLRKDGTLGRLAKELDTPSESELLAAIGYGKIPTAHVLAKLLPADDIDRRRERSEGRLQRLMRLVTRQTSKTGPGVRVTGVDDVLVRFAKCCSPLPGERIVGFITRGRGVTIHSQSCQKVHETDPQRRIDTSWEEGANVPRPVPVQVTCVNQPGLLAAITKAISSTGTNIASARIHSLPDKKALNTFELMIGSLEELNRVMRNLGRVRGVMKVERLRE